MPSNQTSTKSPKKKSPRRKSSRQNTPKRNTPKRNTPKRKTPKKKSIPPPMNPRLVPKAKLKPKPIPTKVYDLPELPPDRLYSRVNPHQAMEQRLSPYFGHAKPTQFGVSETDCQALDLEQLRVIAFQANKLIKNPSERIRGYRSPKMTKELLCQKLILKKITVLADGRVTFLENN